MSTPHYVAVKVGDNYEVRRVDADYRMRVGSAVGGGLALGWLGLRIGRLPGLAMLATGAGLLYYGCTGKNPVAAIKKKMGCIASPSGSPSHHHDDQVRSSQEPQDAVDEAAMESFPASDPPARSAATATL